MCTALERTCFLLRLGPVALCYLPIEGSGLGLRFSPEYKYTRVHVVAVVTPCIIIIIIIILLLLLLLLLTAIALSSGGSGYFTRTQI